MCTWLSRDGGLSWEDVAPYASIYECAPPRPAMSGLKFRPKSGGVGVPALTVTCWGS